MRRPTQLFIRHIFLSAHPNRKLRLRSFSRQLGRQSLQTATVISADPTLGQEALYQAVDTQSHLVVPILYQGELIAVLSLQWSLVYDDLYKVRQMMDLLAAQVALAMANAA